MKAQSQFKSLVIPASQSRTVNITGTSFYLEYSSGVVDCFFDDGVQLRMKSGQTFDCPPGDYFKEIIFTNPDTSSTLTITYYAGTLAVGSRTPGVFSKPAPSYLIAKVYAVTLGNSTLLDSTNLRAGKTIADSRQYVILQWGGTTTEVAGVSHISGSSAIGYNLGTSYGLTVRLDTPGTLYLYGALGASLNVSALQFFNYDS